MERTVLRRFIEQSTQPKDKLNWKKLSWKAERMEELNQEILSAIAENENSTYQELFEEFKTVAEYRDKILELQFEEEVSEEESNDESGHSALKVSKIKKKGSKKVLKLPVLQLTSKPKKEEEEGERSAALNSEVSDKTISLFSMVDFRAPENLGLKDPKEIKLKAKEDEEILNNTKRTVQQDDTGRYEVELPLKNEEVIPQGNKEQVENRILSLQDKLERTENFERCEEVKLDRERERVIEVKEDKESNSYSVPHRPVIKETSTTADCRPVFDGGAKREDKLLFVGEAQAQQLTLEGKLREKCLAGENSTTNGKDELITQTKTTRSGRKYGIKWKKWKKLIFSLFFLFASEYVGNTCKFKPCGK